MMHSELLKRLLPPVAYDLNGPVLSSEIEAEGLAMDAALANADTIHSEADPRSAYSLLADWERVAGLSGLNMSIGQRQAALSAKIAAHGGVSRAYFVSQAQSFGFPGATISEFKPATCNGTCNGAIYSEADRFAWRMNIPNGAGGSATLQAAVRVDCPAHTVAVFLNV